MLGVLASKYFLGQVEKHPLSFLTYRTKKFSAKDSYVANPTTLTLNGQIHTRAMGYFMNVIRKVMSVTKSTAHPT